MLQHETTALPVAMVRVKILMDHGRDYDDEDALFRVGDVRALVDEIERNKPRE